MKPEDLKKTDDEIIYSLTKEELEKYELPHPTDIVYIRTKDQWMFNIEVIISKKHSTYNHDHTLVDLPPKGREYLKKLSKEFKQIIKQIMTKEKQNGFFLHELKIK